MYLRGRDEYISHLSSRSLLPPSSLNSLNQPPPPFTLLYLPLLCALPSLPSLHPSAPLQGRSQGRPAPSIPCFIGWWVLKGQFPPQSAHGSALHTHHSHPSWGCLLYLLHTHSSSHVNAAVTPKTANTRCWRNIWKIHIHRLSCLLKQLCMTGHLSERQKMLAKAHRLWKKPTWPTLTDSQHRLNQADFFLYDKWAWHTTSSADLKNTKQTASKQLGQINSQQNGPRS